MPDEDVQDLKECEVGDCEIKLGADAITRFRKEVDWSKPDAKAKVEQLIRAMGVSYVNAYREGGNSRLAVYRDSDRPTFVAKEFQELIAGMPEFAGELSGMRQFLLRYPKAADSSHEVVHLLAGSEFRTEADGAHQPCRHSRGAGRNGGGVQAAVFLSLLLDRAGAARARSRRHPAARASGSPP